LHQTGAWNTPSRPPRCARSPGYTALQQVWHAGVGQVALTVQPLNPARSLYGRCGFATIGPRNGYHHILVHR
jgi:hypothetical protein